MSRLLADIIVPQDGCQGVMQEGESCAAANYERHNRHNAPLVTGGLRLALSVIHLLGSRTRLVEEAEGHRARNGDGLVVWSLPGFWSRAYRAGVGLQRSASKGRGFSTVRNRAAQPGGGEDRRRGSDDRDSSFERLSLLYQENARVAAAFWEWQHKTLTILLPGSFASLEGQTLPSTRSGARSQSGMTARNYRDSRQDS